MAQQGSTYDKHASGTPRHGRHASSIPSSRDANDSVFNTQDIAVRSRHAAPAQSEQASAPSNLDFGGLDEYAYGAPAEETAGSYSYGVSDVSHEGQESILPDDLRSKSKVPQTLAHGILRVIGIILLFCVVIAIGCCIGLVYLMDVSPLVLFALK
ncbi:MAG: hypothetical protein Q4A43_05720 [Coriobacteriia bacterium]|nr:hypothetical protein [Coriobacteriia bacterium]